jgi:AcrR family transcriptional regulator
MIADRIGVSKAAVYHQFKTKDEIVLAVAETELGGLEATLAAAEAEPDRKMAVELLLAHVIDMAVKRRHLVTTLQSDPVIVRFLAEHEPFMQLMERLYAVLIGDATGAEARVPAAMISAAIGGAVTHPLVMDLDDDTLRVQLMHFTRLFLAL